MKILSQNKNLILNVDMCSGIARNQEQIIGYSTNDNCYILGEYATEDRAQYILETIWRSVKQEIKYYTMWEK